MVDMPPMNALVETIVSGALTGGAGAATTIIAFFRDARKRIEHLEKSIGNPGSSIEPRTGIYLVLEQLGDVSSRAEEIARKARKEMDSWDDEPPDWAARLAGGGRRSSYTNEAYMEFEQRMESRYRSAQERIEELENKLENALRKMRTEYVERSIYEDERRKREEDLRKVRDNLQTANGFLRGVMAALGYLEDSQASPPSGLPPAPPNLVPRPPVLPKRK